MRRILLMCAVVLVAVACIKIGTGGARPVSATPAPVIGWEAVRADSIRITARWGAVQQADGANVPTYLFRYRRNGVTVDSSSVTATTVARTFPLPTVGDSATYIVEVAARDTRGLMSGWGRSIPLLVYGGVWTAPPTPQVEADTLITTAMGDTLNIYPVSFATGERFDTVPVLYMYFDENDVLVGVDSVQYCVEEIVGGVAVGVEGQKPICGGPPPYLGEGSTRGVDLLRWALGADDPVDRVLRAASALRGS